MLRGALSGFMGARPGSKTSIGKVFQERAEHYGDRVFIMHGDPASVKRTRKDAYRQANEIANRYAAVLAAHGVGRGDVVGIVLKNAPRTVLLMLAVVKLGAIAGMLNYHQRGQVLAHSMGVLDAKMLIGEAEGLNAVKESGAPVADALTIDDVERLAVDAATGNPAVTSTLLAKDKAFYIFTSGTTGAPKASVMTHYRWLRAMAGFGEIGMRLHRDDTVYCCLPLYHNNALTVAVGSVLSAGATLALGESFSASRFWDEVIASDATAFVYIGEICRYLLNQPPKPTDRAHKVRVIAGNGLRPEIWDDFTERFGIARVCEFYAASEGNTAFVNVFNVPKTAGICPTPVAFVTYDPDTGQPLRDERGRVRKVRSGEAGLLLSKVSNFQPFDGYTDPKASEKKLVRNAFRDGDVWFNTGDLMRHQGFGHAAFVDRLGDTFRWKGENVATTEVEAAVASYPDVEECHGVRCADPRHRRPGGHGRHTTAGGHRVRRQGVERAVYDRLPAYALPLFVRVVDSTGAHHNVQEPQSGPARTGLRRRRQGPAVCAGRPRRWLCAVLRRLRRRGGRRRPAQGVTKRLAAQGLTPPAHPRSRWPARCPTRHHGRHLAGAQSTFCGRPVADDRPLIMAIVNRTPDSFYDRGATFTDEAARAAAHRVDRRGRRRHRCRRRQGGPGESIDAEAEIARVVPFIEWLRDVYPEQLISVDTWRSEVARLACRAGADLINDTWGGYDPAMPEVAAEFGAGPGVLAHRGCAAAHPAVPGQLRHQHPRRRRRRDPRSHRGS